MSAGSWEKPSWTGRLIACGLIAAIHAIVLMSQQSRNIPMHGNSIEGNHTIFLLRPRVNQLASQGINTKKPSQSFSGKRPLSTIRPDQRPTPDEAGASDESSADDQGSTIEKSADVAPDWTAGRSVKPAPSTDIRTYSLSLAGKADAEARQGKPVTLEPVDTPFKRMQSKMAQAATGGGNSTTIVTSSSGEPITIITRGGRARCYVPVSTSVAPSAVFDNRGSGRSTEVQCPKGVR